MRPEAPPAPLANPVCSLAVHTRWPSSTTREEQAPGKELALWLELPGLLPHPPWASVSSLAHQADES